MKYIGFYGNFRKASLTIAQHCYARKGVWSHELFDYLNEALFGGRLPHPHIIWGLTAYGSCYAWASCSREKLRQPVITLHPALIGESIDESPWGIPRRWLGPALAFDTLLHECIHLHVECNRGGQKGPTSHNCDRWLRQVNRLAIELGFEGVRMGRSKTVRVPALAAPRTVRGRVATRVVRRCEGNVPFTVGAGFPMSLRRYLGTADEYYTAKAVPPGAPEL